MTKNIMTGNTKGLVLILGAGTLGSSCDALDDAASYIAPVAAEVILFNIPGDQLEAYDIPAQSAVTLMVAIGRLVDGGESSSSPFSGEVVDDAIVTLTLPDGTVYDVPPLEGAEGIYTLISSSDTPAFTYQPGDDYVVDMAFSDSTYQVRITAADAVELTDPPEAMSYHAPGTDLELAWTPPSDSALTLLYDAQGNLLYDNIPQDLNGIYSFLTSSDVSSLTIPGDYFSAPSADSPESAVYAIGLAGLYKEEITSDRISENLNYLVTNAASGTAVVTTVTTLQEEIPTE